MTDLPESLRVVPNIQINARILRVLHMTRAYWQGVVDAGGPPFTRYADKQIRACDSEIKKREAV